MSHLCLSNFELKGDLEHLRAVKPDKHTKFAKEKGLNSYLVSARTGESVIELFFIHNVFHSILKEKYISFN